MKLSLERTHAKLWPSGWFMGGVSIWLVLVLTVHLLNTYTGQEMLLCTLRRVTGVPCPTCGSTRAVAAIFSGDLAAAFFYNPLVVVMLALGAGLLVLRLVWRRSIKLDLSRNERIFAWLVFFVLLGINWWHVIDYHRHLPTG